MTTLEEFAQQAGPKFTKQLRTLELRGALAGALVVKTAVEGSIAASGASNMKLSNAGRNGAPIGARVRKRSHDAIVTAKGPLWLLDNPTKPHVIKARANTFTAKGTRRKGAKALNIPGVGPRASVVSPGTKGKRTFHKGVAAAAPEVPKAVRTALAFDMAKTFR